MKELGITVNKILKDWLQSKGDGDIVFTDDIAINEVTDEIVAECQDKYSELMKQRDELREALKQIISIDQNSRLFNSVSITMANIAEAAIKNTDG